MLPNLKPPVYRSSQPSRIVFFIPTTSSSSSRRTSSRHFTIWAGSSKTMVWDDQGTQALLVTMFLLSSTSSFCFTRFAWSDSVQWRTENFWTGNINYAPRRALYLTTAVKKHWNITVVRAIQFFQSPLSWFASCPLHFCRFLATADGQCRSDLVSGFQMGSADLNWVYV